MWKVPLDANDGDTALLIKRYTYPVPNGGMLVPAGYRVAVAFTFKSGDTWTPNVDFFDDLNNFRGIFSQNTVGGQMPYFYYSAKDRNGSALMFSTDTSWYLPSVVIEAVNQPTFSYEFLSAGIHARDTAIIDNVNDIAKAINVKAYPNPAKGSVSIDYQLETANAVTISITNTVGQVLKVKTLDKAVSGRTSFDVSDLASGVYFYTIEADGRRVTHRLAVTN